MAELVPLSTVRLDPAWGILRDCPRPPEMRNATFAERYDWNTLFYDVYRVGPHVVFQGPPFFSFLDRLKQGDPFRRAFGFPTFRASHYGMEKRGEIWLRSDADHFSLDGPLGHHEIAVQPSGADIFAGRRVLLTISKDNRPEWIEDWVRFHRAHHGADGLLFYDNGSTAYTAAELQARLIAAFPDMAIVVVDWRFPFGPSGGKAGAVNGVEAPWDSDFCQPGKTQHARWRFLQQAKSVLNADVDELVIANGSRTVFEAAEQDGFAKFTGHWIVNAADGEAPFRHADFTRRRASDPEICPPKWAVAPGTFGRKCTWSVHNIFGTRANAAVSDEFTYRHFKGISTSWKYDRSEPAPDPASLQTDTVLAAAMKTAGLAPSAALEKRASVVL